MLLYVFRVLVFAILTIGFFNNPVTANDVFKAQKLLTKLGYTPGPTDGRYGANTKHALENFYAAQNKKFDGKLSANEIASLQKALKNPDFSFEALKMMDDHVKQSALLKVPMPSNNLVIKDYRRFRHYRMTNYEDDLSFTSNIKKWLWKEIKTSGNILSKEYCYETLAKFLAPTTPDEINVGRTDQDFTDCTKSLHVFSLINFDASFELYEKLFLEMATSKKDYWTYRRSNTKDMNPTFYHLGGVISTFYMYYAVNYEAFNYTKKERSLIENYFKKKAFAERFNLDGDRRTSLCPIKNPMKFNRRIHILNNCESVRLRFAAGELALAIVTQDRALWQKGLWDLDFSLSMINDEGFFVPLSAKGCKSLGYTYATSKLFSLNVEMLKLAGFNLLDYNSRHGKTISQAYEMLFKQYEDITISNHIAKKSFGAVSCGMKPYETHNEFLAWEAGFGDPKLSVGVFRYKKAYDPNNNMDPDLADYTSWSIRFVSEKHPEWVKENLLQDIKTDFDSNQYFTVNPFEIYNANVMSEPKSIWKEKRKKILLEAKIKKERKERKYKKTQHVQHERYSKHIATPFRDLNVYEGFTLINDFSTFIEMHERKLKGKLPNTLGPLSYLLDQDLSLEECANIFDKKSLKNAIGSPGADSPQIHDFALNCGNIISQVFLNDPNKGVNIYRKILEGWLMHGIIQNPNLYIKNIPGNNSQAWAYAISSFVPNIFAHYSIYHKLYDFDPTTHQNITNMGEAFFAQWDYYPAIVKENEWRTKICDLTSQFKIVRSTNDHCGSYTFRMATGGIYFGLEFNSQIAFDTGVRNLEVMMATFNKDAVYVPQAVRGICALGYMGQFPSHFELIHYAFQKAYGIDFINTKNINGVTPADAYLKLWEIAHDPLETVVKYWNGHDQMSCSENGKNQAEMVQQLKRNPSSYRDFWNGFNDKKFIFTSPFLSKHKLPKEWRSTLILETMIGQDVEHAMQSHDTMGINPYLLQLALGKFEDELSEYFEEIKEEERKREKAERLRKREMLFAYDGTYKVQLGLYRNTIDGQIYQDLGSILFTLNRGQPKLNESSILYQKLGLSDTNFSLNYDGSMIVSGGFPGDIVSERRCFYIAGNLKLNKKFNPKSSQNCGANDQSLAMKFEKISDDVNFDFVDEKELKKLDGEYDVQWFITNINTNERSLHAKDTLTLSNGIGVFEGNEPNKQPSSKLRRELSIQYNANGEIIILGRIDLFEKVDVKQWYASGKISPMKKSKLKTIWGFGDIIELEIEKSKISEIPKVKEMKAEELIYGDDFIFNKKNNSFQLKRLDEIIKINKNDFSLNFDSNDEKFFDGDISYTTNANNFGTTWIGLKVKKTDEVSHNIKIAFQIEEGSFPNFSQAFSISKNECGVFKDMVDDSFIIPLKTDDLFELELFDCHVKVLQENLNDDDFGILKNRINTAISLVDTIEITNKYF